MKIKVDGKYISIDDAFKILGISNKNPEQEIQTFDEMEIIYFQPMQK